MHKHHTYVVWSHIQPLLTACVTAIVQLKHQSINQSPQTVQWYTDVCGEQSKTPPPPMHACMSTHFGVGGVQQETGPSGLDWNDGEDRILGELSQEGRYNQWTHQLGEKETCNLHTHMHMHTQTHTCTSMYVHKHSGHTNSELKQWILPPPNTLPYTPALSVDTTVCGDITGLVHSSQVALGSMPSPWCGGKQPWGGGGEE